MAKREFRVGPTQVGMRLDRFLLAAQTGASRRALALSIDEERVTINGRPARKGDRVELGDHIQFDPEAMLVVAQPSPAPAELVLVTSELVIMNKAPGVPPCATPGRVSGTAAGQLLHLFPELAEVGYGPREPGLVHRLDTQTSGLLLAARSTASFDRLRASMQAGAIEKRYLAIAHGTTAIDGRIDRSLEPDPSDARRVRTRDASGPRVTAFRRLDVRGDFSLLEVTLVRGYRHQIRAHLASVGAPLAGDVLYGGQGVGLAPRHALHASFMACTQGPIQFEARADLPEDLVTFWANLEGR